MTVANLYLDIAKEDLNASRILLNNQCYSQALFYTEQSVEKICKYIIIKDDIIDESKLKKEVRHNSTKIFDILIKYILEKRTSEQCFNDTNIESFYENIKESKEYFVKLRNDSKLKEIGEEKLDEYDRELYFYSKLNKNLNTEYDFMINQPAEGFLELLKKMNLLDNETLTEAESRLNNPAEKDSYLNLINNIIKDLPKYQNLLMAVITLATIFSNHWESTRYPSQIEKLKPSDLYNQEKPLIKRLGNFHRHIENTINELETLNI